MSLDHHKALARRAQALWASGNADRPDDLFTDAYVNHQESDIEGTVTALDRQAYTELVAGFHRSFSEALVEVSMQIAESDLVATRWERTATHTGYFLELPPTGQRVSWTGIQIDRFAHGKIAESWVDWDKYGLFRQLGLAE
jgi:predicted ester cyclase